MLNQRETSIPMLRVRLAMEVQARDCRMGEPQSHSAACRTQKSEAAKLGIGDRRDERWFQIQPHVAVLVDSEPVMTMGGCSACERWGIRGAEQLRWSYLRLKSGV